MTTTIGAFYLYSRIYKAVTWSASSFNITLDMTNIYFSLK